MLLSGMWISVILISLPPHIDTSCSAPQNILDQAREIDKEHSKLTTTKDGVLVDNRGPIFSRFANDCLNDFFKRDEEKYNEKQKHLIFSAVSKTYFYSRDKNLLKEYKTYLNTSGNEYPPGKKYIQENLVQFRGRELTGRKIISSDGSLTDFTEQNVILIISSPYCENSKDLKQWISRELPNISTNIIWAVRRPIGMSIDEFQVNRDYTNYSLLLNSSDWDDIGVWDTPTVLHVQNGKVIRQQVGNLPETKKYLKEYEEFQVAN